MSSERAILSLGSNLGDREAIIRDAISDLSTLPGVTVVACSGLYETPAMKPEGVDAPAPDYLNAAVAIDTTLAPEELLDAINGVEADHGRVRAVRWGDRTLDIDIVTMGGRIQQSERLTLPHPGAGTRAFVLMPWLEIDSEAELPGLGRADALLETTDRDIRQHISETTS